MSDYFLAKDKLISEIFFAPRFKYEIPRFQRPYAWEDQNLEELWETLQLSQTTFIGTLIFNIHRKDSERVIEIIDGQQRYLTYSIFGAVLRDTCNKIYKEKGADQFRKLSEHFEEQFIGKEHIPTNSFNYYLIAGESIKEFFHDNIQNSHHLPISDLKVKRKSEEERIVNCYLKFSELIADSIEGLELDAIYQFLYDLEEAFGNLTVVSIDIDNEDQAYEIFETVNARGIDLSVADLVKNQIFKYVNEGKGNYKDIALEFWNNIQENLDVFLNMKEFLRYFWTSKYEYVSDRKLYKAIKLKFADDPNKWNKFLEELYDASNQMRLLFNGSHEEIRKEFNRNNDAENIIHCLRVLRNTKAKTWTVLFLTIFRNYKSIPIRLKRKWEIFEKFTFLYFHILNQPGNWFFKKVTEYSNKIQNLVENDAKEDEWNHLFENLFREFNARIDFKKEIFLDGFSEIKYKNDPKSRVIVRYLLNEIELYLGGAEDEGYDESKVSIEHILPQEPKDWGLNKKDIKSVVDSIGNLTLISKDFNSKMGNRKFDKKLEYLSQSKLKQVEEIVSNHREGIWDFNEISKYNFNTLKTREAYLTELCYNIWVENLRKKMGLGN